MSGWGETAGVWTCWRAGGLESPRGIFLADCHDAAWLYAQSSGQPVVAWDVRVERVFVARNQYDIVARRQGVTVEELRASKSCARNPYWMRDADMAIRASALRAGYDAVLYTVTLTPLGERELVVFDAARLHCLGECLPDGSLPPPQAPRP